MAEVVLQEFSWDRVIRAVEKVKDRFHRSAALLESAQIPYAVVGGNAVTAWVSRVDEAAVRNTPNVDILIHREDFESVRHIFQEACISYRSGGRVEVFPYDPEAKPRDAVHLLFTGERVRPGDFFSLPGLESSVPHETYRIIELTTLVQMKLSAYRTIDRVHLLDMLDVGLLDTTWPGRFPPELGVRLQVLIDDPDG